MRTSIAMTRQDALASSQRDVNMPCWKQIAENPKYSTKDISFSQNYVI
jgi:hypothetical protein